MLGNSTFGTFCTFPLRYALTVPHCTAPLRSSRRTHKLHAKVEFPKTCLEEASA